MSGYIIVFNADVAKATVAAVAEQVVAQGGSISHRYYESEHPILNGFAAIVPEDFVGSLQANADIKYVEKDAEVRIQ